MRVAVIVATLICIVLAYSNYQHKREQTYQENKPIKKGGSKHHDQKWKISDQQKKPCHKSEKKNQKEQRNSKGVASSEQQPIAERKTQNQRKNDKYQSSKPKQSKISPQKQWENSEKTDKGQRKHQNKHYPHQKHQQNIQDTIEKTKNTDKKVERKHVKKGFVDNKNVKSEIQKFENHEDKNTDDKIDSNVKITDTKRNHNNGKGQSVRKNSKQWNKKEQGHKTEQKEFNDKHKKHTGKDRPIKPIKIQQSRQNGDLQKVNKTTLEPEVSVSEVKETQILIDQQPPKIDTQEEIKEGEQNSDKSNKSANSKLLESSQQQGQTIQSSEVKPPVQTEKAKEQQQKTEESDHSNKDNEGFIVETKLQNIDETQELTE